MKRETAFFKDKRAGGAGAIIDAMLAVGMTRKEIRTALLKKRADDLWETVQAAKNIGHDAVSNAYNKYRDAYAEYYQSTL